MLKNDNIQDIYSLSPLQEGMYFYSLYKSDSQAYFEQISYAVRGSLDKEIFRESLEKLFARHDVLRTVFNHRKVSKPLQVVLKTVPAPLYFHDIQGLTAEEQDAHIHAFKITDKQTKFDLSRDVLMRVNVLQTGGDRFLIIWSYHHILMDGWCVSLLIDEFYKIYHSILSSQPLRLEPVRPYKNYIKWLTDRDNHSSLPYWTQYLSGYTRATPLPRSMAGSGLVARGGSVAEAEGSPVAGDAGRESYRAEQKAFELDTARRTGLQAIVLEYGVTWSNLIQMIWGILLAKYNQVNDVVFGLVVSGRPAEVEGVETMIGLFINTIPVRLKYGAGATFSDKLKEIHQASIDANPHQYEQLSEIQSFAELGNGLLDHILVFDNYPLSDQLTGISGQGDNDEDGFLLSNVETFEQTNYDLNVLVNLGERVWVNFNFNNIAYTGAFISRVWDHMNLIIDQVIHDPKIAIDDISLVSDQDMKKFFSRDDEFINARYRHFYLRNVDGKPLTGKKIYLLDEKGQPLPAGFKGEICIDAGEMDAGFRHQDNFDAGNFAAHPLVPEGRLYRTGDMGHWRSDGTLEYRGRKEEEFLVRGFRVESFQVKEVLMSYDKIRDAEVMAVKGIAEEEWLVAFYTADHSLDTAGLRQLLGKSLPAYMIPDRFVHFEKFPVTLTGDIDRAALLKAQRTILSEEPDFAPATNSIEEQLAAIWSEVLAKERVGIDDNFFRIMGNSIKAIQIVSRMYKAGYKISIRNIFTYPTIRELAALLSVTAETDTALTKEFNEYSTSRN